MSSDKNNKTGYYSSLTGFRRAVPIILAAVAVFITVCLMADGTGIAGMGISSVLFGLFSFGAYAIPPVIALHAIFYAEDVAKSRVLSRVIFSAITVLMVSCVEYTVCFWGEEIVFAPVEFFKEASCGGFIGSVIAFGITKILGPVGLVIVAAATLAIYIAFFFADRGGAFGRFMLAVLGGIANALAAVERAFKKLVGKAKNVKEKKERRYAEKKSSELLDDPFFAVDNGLKELKISELGIVESRSGSTLEENPTLQDRVFHKSAVKDGESEPKTHDNENEVSDSEPVYTPKKKKTVNLSYGDELKETTAREKKDDIIYDGAVFGISATPSAPKAKRQSYGIDESAESVFTSDFNPFDFEAAEKIASKASSKATPAPAQDSGIGQVERPINMPSAEEVARQKRLEEFERRKQAIIERSKAEQAASAAPATQNPSPAETVNTAPANNAAPTNTVPVYNATPVNTATSYGAAAEIANNAPTYTAASAPVEAAASTVATQPTSRESTKTVEFNVINEPRQVGGAPVEGGAVKKTFEKHDYKATGADEAAVLIAEAVAMKNPAYARSANELRIRTTVIEDPVTEAVPTAPVAPINEAPVATEAVYDTPDVAETVYETFESAPTVGVVNEYKTATFTESQAPEFKPYEGAVEAARGANVAENAPEEELKVERTMLSPTADAEYKSAMESRDEKYTVIGEEMPPVAEPVIIDEEDSSVIWTTGDDNAFSVTETVTVSDEGTVFNFGGDDEEDEEEGEIIDGTSEIFGALDEDDSDDEIIPPEEQNPEVLRQRQMFPFLGDVEPAAAAPQKTAPVEAAVEVADSTAEDTVAYEDDEPPFAEATLVAPAPATPATKIEKPAPQKEEKPAQKKPDYSNYEFPSIELLGVDNEVFDDNVQYEIQENADRLIDTLSSFNVTASIKGVDRGPRITRYEVVPAKGVKVSSIMNLQDDIALSLAADGIRMEAPIPGKSAVGVEIPNKKSSTVRLRELLETEDFRSMKSKTAVCIGKDVAGQPVINDVAKMPHLLIAGATGMGKSVCINSLLISILYKARPDEVKLIMIDPKQVEFTMYNGIPHLLIPVVSDAKQAAGALMWAVEEMERRYNLLNPMCVRNIDAYNEKIAANPSLGEPMSKIVIVIDEFADLMLQVKDPVENLVMRLAQKARAAGIYLIVGTQRPSTNVITGVIKANIPSRISCKVASNVDSRTVLDAVGAEKLLNKGDMLFSYAGAIKPLRVQGAFVADSEVEAIMAHLKQFSNGESYDEAVMEEIKRAADKCTKKSGGGSDRDDDGDGSEGEGYLNDKQFLDAVEVAVNTGKMSTALLQRKLSIGYGKAARYIDVMCDMGIISEPNGQKPRDVLITPDEWHEKLARTMID